VRRLTVSAVLSLGDHPELRQRAEQPVRDRPVNAYVVGYLLDRQPGWGRGDQLQRRQTPCQGLRAGAPFGAAVPLASLTAAIAPLSLTDALARVML